MPGNPPLPGAPAPPAAPAAPPAPAAPAAPASPPFVEATAEPPAPTVVVPVPVAPSTYGGASEPHPGRQRTRNPNGRNVTSASVTRTRRPQRATRIEAAGRRGHAAQ